MIQKKWHYKETPKKESIHALSQAINTSRIISTLLLQRGITNYEEAKDFFNPTLAQLHDPWQMKGMDIAVARLIKAIEQKEAIGIYGDYDVDGTTSVALLYEGLKSMGAIVSYYIPDRYKEGYGLSDRGVMHYKEKKIKVLICIDCGTRAVEKIAKANESGMEVIVCDHHEPGAILPPALAMLNPKQSDCLYPFKELSACGIGFKMLQALSERGWMNKEALTKYLDLVVLSIAADIVPMIGENRILATFGLQVLNRSPRHGLALLKKQSGFTNDFHIDNIVFKLAPRINAPGRVSHAKQAVELLLASDKESPHELVVAIEQDNQRRRTLDQDIVEEALALIAVDTYYPSRCTTVLFKENWHKGVVGIAAARCIEHHYRPTVILTQQGDFAVGSARSVLGYNLYNAINSCGGLLTRYGGHAYAAGLTLPIKNLELFKEKFEEVVKKTITKDQLIPSQTIDLVIHLKEISEKCYGVLNRMRPFGPAYRQPVFVTYRVVAKAYEIYQSQHLKIFLQEVRDSHVWESIGFGMANLVGLIQNKKEFSIAYKTELSTFRGRSKIQLVLKDIGPYTGNHQDF